MTPAPKLRSASPQRSSLSARYPVNGAWPAEMRIDMLAAYLDFRSVRELVLAVSRGEAPPPTRYRGVGRAREAIWVKVIVDEHVAPGIDGQAESSESRLGSARMKPLRTALKLPRYCRRKPLKNGRWAYFFEPPTWARTQGCPFEAEALGQNYDAAVARAENVLLPAFDSWRTGGLSDLAPIGVTQGVLRLAGARVQEATEMERRRCPYQANL